MKERNQQMQKEKVEEMVDWDGLDGTPERKKIPLRLLPPCKSIFVLKPLPHS